MNKIYLDYNSTTPVDERVVAAMLPYFTEVYGNPSSIHSFGQDAQNAVDMARFHVSQLIGSNIDEVLFTSGGTESNNFALSGLQKLYTKRGKNHIITSMIEHSSIYNQCQALEEQGLVKVTYLPVDEFGQVDPADVEAAITDKTALISIMLANNEFGTIQNLKAIADVATSKRVIVHTDAVQALGKMVIDVDDLGVDMISISSHKVYGPKGVGALYVRRGLKLTPLMNGGGQETKRRSGTENVPGIVGFGKACELLKANLNENIDRLLCLRDRLEQGVCSNLPNAKVNGHLTERTPNTSNISFEGCENETMVVQFDLEGLAVSSGSACGEAHRVASRSLKALGLPSTRIYSALRFSIGNYTTEADIDTAVEVISRVARPQ